VLTGRPASLVVGQRLPAAFSEDVPNASRASVATFSVSAATWASSSAAGVKEADDEPVAVQVNGRYIRSGTAWIGPSLSSSSRDTCSHPDTPP
jgi:hypothetical protein